MSDITPQAVREYLEKVVARIYPPSEVIARFCAGGSALAEMANQVSDLRASADAVAKLSPIPPDFRLGKYWQARGLQFAAHQMADRGEVTRSNEPASAPPRVDLSPLERQLRELMEAVADIASANLRMQQDLAEAQQVIGVLARVVCAAQVYSADGKPVTIGLPASQVQALQRAMERAA